MRSAPAPNETLLKIQNEINEVERRENELREQHSKVGETKQNGTSEDSNPKILQRAASAPVPATQNSSVTNGARRFVPNSKGVMQKFFKLRGKLTAVNSISNPTVEPVEPVAKPAWSPDVVDVVTAPPVKALIPTDKPLRRGYVPVEKRILSELREMEHREQELKTERRKSQPDLMAALEAEQNLEVEDEEISRTPSPVVGNIISLVI